MPDMAHSLAVEANTYNYYFANTWDEESTLPLKVTSAAKLPVNGTVPRSMGSMEGGAANGVDAYGSVPYHYADTEEGRAAATNGILENPFPITADGIAAGKELYNTFCGVCHGSGGKNGDGIYASGIYPLAPANLVGDSLIRTSSPGRYYHAIMYGKNAMGAYKDKLSYEERWQVMHYIRSMQAKETETLYSEEANTLNTYGITLTKWESMQAQIAETGVDILSEMENRGDDVTDEFLHEGEHAHDGDHSHDESH